jgi:hypothetical protein
MVPVSPIRVSWWNTGLAPVGKSRGNEARYQTAAKVLQQLLHDEGADLLALGEVLPADVEACLSLLPSKTKLRSQWRAPRERVGRASAVVVFYDPRVLTLLEDTLLSDSWGGVALQSGWHLVFAASDGKAVLNVVVVHWPSHRIEEAARKRDWIAASLYRRFREDRDVLILGDFNDEPVSTSLRDGLVAYRDRALVRLRVAAYYNPFWRLLGEQQAMEHEGARRLPAGTHFHRAGTSTRWVTYDQIVVSSAMIRPNTWQLVESATQVVVHEALLTQNGTMRDTFDHLPVASAIAYTPEGVDG